MSALTLSWYYLWVAPALLQMGLAAVMVRRGLHRQFPVFFTFTVSEAVMALVLLDFCLAPSISSAQYIWAYCLIRIVSTALRFGVLHELFAHLSHDYGSLRRFGRPFFRWATVALLLLGLALAVRASAGSDVTWFRQNVLDRTVILVQGGLLLGLFLFSTSLGLSWRNQVFGIGLGLGFFLSTELIASAVRTQFGFARFVTLDLFTMGAYHVCVLVWAFYMLLPERMPNFTARKLPAHDLESWNNELIRLLQR